jgi:UrcA family protein
MDQSKSVPPIFVAGVATMLLTCAFAASGAFASEPDGQVRTEGIKYEDLNLSTTAGVGVLYQRIHSAAQRVCAVSGQPELGAASAAAKCSKDAETQAIEKMNLPALTEFGAHR